MTSSPLHGCFITAIGTDVGKTLVSTAIIYGLRQSGVSVCAVKPVETGCDPAPLDAIALAHACGRPSLATHPGFFRAVSPVAPAAAALLEDIAPPHLASLRTACLECATPNDFLLVEGAGGVLVPINEHETVADLIASIRLPAIVIAHDILGTLSHTLCAYEALERRAIPVRAVILNQRSAVPPELLAGPASNRAQLQARLPVPVLSFPHCGPHTEPEVLGRVAIAAGIVQALDPLMSATRTS